MANQISTQAANAFMSAKEFKLDNTSVTIEPVAFGPFEEKMVVLKLHGNKIAQRLVGSNEIEVSNGGWSSKTTKERLNAIPGVSVVQKKGQWFLNGDAWEGEWIVV